MDLSSGDISALVFKPVVRDDLGNFSLDGHMLSVLMALDGKKPLGQIAQSAGMNMATMREAVGKSCKAPARWSMGISWRI